jgi:two-component system osmolarity sensor histidine kinase EnvZ
MKLQLAMMTGDEIGDLAEDVADMERMIEGYLAFARGEGTEASRPADLAALVEDAVARARRDGGRIEVVCEGDLAMPLKAQAMSRCLANLIGNAVRYASNVKVTAHRSGDAAEVIVDDDGPGIPVDYRELVFKPFYRIEGSRNPKTGGVGLGLTIAREVARGHGGNIVLEDSPMTGLRVRLMLPL